MMRLRDAGRESDTLPSASAFSCIAGSSAPALFGTDPVMERLVRSLLPEEQAVRTLREFYADRPLTVRHDCQPTGGHDLPAQPNRRKSVALPRWRLQRVLEHVEANLEYRLTLAALAEAAGLNRMYFAEQFRTATGLRPHDYVVRRRIQRAQSLLAQSDAPIAGVALNVGFQSQAHFTTVFKRIAGATPQRWRTQYARASQAMH